jgi:hypothetical protein
VTPLSVAQKQYYNHPSPRSSNVLPPRGGRSNVPGNYAYYSPPLDDWPTIEYDFSKPVGNQSGRKNTDEIEKEEPAPAYDSRDKPLANDSGAYPTSYHFPSQHSYFTWNTFQRDAYEDTFNSCSYEEGYSDDISDTISYSSSDCGRSEDTHSDWSSDEYYYSEDDY